MVDWLSGLVHSAVTLQNEGRDLPEIWGMFFIIIYNWLTSHAHDNIAQSHIVGMAI